jgi:hypothetical protein
MIKKWKKFKESISGTTDTSPFGPSSHRQELQNTLSVGDTQSILGMDGKLYFEDDYLDLLQKVKLRNIPREFNKKNLDTLLFTLK